MKVKAQNSEDLEQLCGKLLYNQIAVGKAILREIPSSESEEPSLAASTLGLLPSGPPDPLCSCKGQVWLPLWPRACVLPGRVGQSGAPEGLHHLHPGLALPAAAAPHAGLLRQDGYMLQVKKRVGDCSVLWIIHRRKCPRSSCQSHEMLFSLQVLSLSYATGGAFARNPESSVI